MTVSKKRRKKPFKEVEDVPDKGLGRINNLIIVNDTHCGCKMGLCCPGKIPLTDGGSYSISPLQRKMWYRWEVFWNEWVPQVTKEEPFGLVHNGDLIDGVHHNSTTQISHDLNDQARIAKRVMRPIIENPLCKMYYQIIGTEAHVGKSGVEEERIAEELGAKQDQYGRYARYELWIQVGKGLAHIMHHIGTTSSTNYESTAVHAELIAEFTEAGRWHERPPDFVIRAHRHRFCQTLIPAELGDATSIANAGWQLKTPYVFRKAGARIAPPQMGGLMLRQGDEDIYPRHKVWTLGRDKVEIL